MFKGTRPPASRRSNASRAPSITKPEARTTTGSARSPGDTQPGPPPRFPASVCGVVYEGSTRQTGCQFTFTCDGSLIASPMRPAGGAAYKIAEAALSGAVYAPVGYATHYHADYVVPYWASTLAKNAVVGAHIFYRWAGGWGRPAPLPKPMPGMSPARLRCATPRSRLFTPARFQSQGSEVAEAIKDIPGAEAIKLSPDLRGDKRVAIRFNLAARKASDAGEPRGLCQEVRSVRQSQMVALERSRRSGRKAPRQGGWSHCAGGTAGAAAQR